MAYQPPAPPPGGARKYLEPSAAQSGRAPLGAYDAQTDVGDLLTGRRSPQPPRPAPTKQEMDAMVMRANAGMVASGKSPGLAAKINAGQFNTGQPIPQSAGPSPFNPGNTYAPGGGPVGPTRIDTPFAYPPRPTGPIGPMPTGPGADQPLPGGPGSLPPWMGGSPGAGQPPPGVDPGYGAPPPDYGYGPGQDMSPYVKQAPQALPSGGLAPGIREALTASVGGRTQPPRFTSPIIPEPATPVGQTPGGPPMYPGGGRTGPGGPAKPPAKPPTPTPTKPPRGGR